MIIEISTAEALDKLSILTIKLDYIQDSSKLKNIKKEQEHLLEKCKNILDDIQVLSLYNELITTNKRLWKIEDAIRIKEKDQLFDENFITLARKVYFTNDERSKIKKQINILTESNFIEEKDYVQY